MLCWSLPVQPIIKQYIYEVFLGKITWKLFVDSEYSQIFLQIWGGGGWGGSVIFEWKLVFLLEILYNVKDLSSCLSWDKWYIAELSKWPSADVLGPDRHVSKSEKGVAWQRLLQLFQGTSQKQRPRLLFNRTPYIATAPSIASIAPIAP